MMKLRRILALLLALALCVALWGCGAKKTLTCDGCGKTFEVAADSEMTEEWIILCTACEREAFGEEGLVPAQ